MTTCPYCNHKLNGDIALPLMPRRQLRIYRAVAAASRNGIEKTALIKAMFDNEPISSTSSLMLRVQICGLNKIIASMKQRVVAKRGMGYYLVVVE